jgi:hypothetical protein
MTMNMIADENYPVYLTMMNNGMINWKAADGNAWRGSTALNDDSRRLM